MGAFRSLEVQLASTDPNSTYVLQESLNLALFWAPVQQAFVCVWPC
jgi:hypothetical protein